MRNRLNPTPATPSTRRISCAIAFALGSFFLSPNLFPAEFGISVPLVDKGSSALYVKGTIKGFGSTEFMVDTGSGYTTITEGTLAALKANGNADYVRDLSGVMADGRRRQVPVYRLAQIHIGDSCVFRDVEAAIFQGAPRNILGLNILKKAAPFTLSMEPPSLMLSNCGIRLAELPQS